MEQRVLQRLPAGVHEEEKAEMKPRVRFLMVRQWIHYHPRGWFYDERIKPHFKLVA